MTLKHKKIQLEGYFLPGITRDLIDISERDLKIYKKYGHFSATFLAQYEEDFSNPGLFHQFCKDIRIR